MTIKSLDELSDRKIDIDLTGPEGNAFFLIARVNKFCKQLGRDPKPIISEMKSGDYENVLKVFDREFGDFVNLYR